MAILLYRWIAIGYRRKSFCPYLELELQEYDKERMPKAYWEEVHQTLGQIQRKYKIRGTDGLNLSLIGISSKDIDLDRFP